jgi:NAD dependent epimerase/dehydratase
VAASRILVTGAGGFIGSHLVEALVGLGHSVRAFVRYNGRSDPGRLRLLRPETYREVEIAFGDLRDSNAVSGACRDVDIVYHLGALVGIPYSYVHPRETVETNVTGTLNVLLAARDQGVKRLVHTSTSEVYGTARAIPISEEHPLQSQSPYSASKTAADMLAQSFFLSFGLPVVTIRPFNTYGPRQSARAVIVTAIVQALTGDVVRLGDLSPTRDLNYVTDTVQGFVNAGFSDRCMGKVINLASNKEISIGELADRIVSIIGRPVKVESDPVRRRPGASEVMRLRGDGRLAKELLGWTPKVELGEGLRRTVDWVRSHLHEFDAGRYEA